MAATLDLRAEAIRSLAFGSISGSYADVGTQLGRPIRIMYIQNNTDASMMFSFDGVNDHIFLPANSFFLVDVTANQISNVNGFYISKGTQMQVKQISGAPTSGSVYISAFYARGS
jgi:hypothetical protein